jgi:Sap, sulfolipid-1-addressing protein
MPASGAIGKSAGMSPEALVLALGSIIRPRSAAAVYAMLSAERATRLLLAYLVAGLVVSVAIGIGASSLLVPATGAHVTPAARGVLNLVLGTAALGYAAGVLSGMIRRRERRPELSGHSRISRWLTDLSPPSAAILGVLTHLPGLFYLAALNAIAGSSRSELHAIAQIVVYNAIWFALPAVALAFAAFRPAEVRRLLGQLADALRRREPGIVVVIFAALGAYLVGKGLFALR